MQQLTNPNLRPVTRYSATFAGHAWSATDLGDNKTFLTRTCSGCWGENGRWIATRHHVERTVATDKLG